MTSVGRGPAAAMESNPVDAEVIGQGYRKPSALVDVVDAVLAAS